MYVQKEAEICHIAWRNKCAFFCFFHTYDVHEGAQNNKQKGVRREKKEWEERQAKRTILLEKCAQCIASDSSHSSCVFASAHRPLFNETDFHYSAKATLVNFLKGMIGPGCLSLPLAFRQAGLWVSFVVCLCVGCVCCPIQKKDSGKINIWLFLSKSVAERWVEKCFSCNT